MNDKRALHNALERERRENIKEHFDELRRAIPEKLRESRASRTQVMRDASQCIRIKRCKLDKDRQRIEALTAENKKLERFIKKLSRGQMPDDLHRFLSAKTGTDMDEGFEAACQNYLQMDEDALSLMTTFNIERHA